MHFSLRFSPSEEIRLIISVSKKVSKKAVVRNTVKRRVRAAFRELSLSLKPGKYLFIARAGSEEVKGEALKKELQGLISKV